VFLYLYLSNLSFSQTIPADTCTTCATDESLPLFDNLNDVLYKDAAHAYDDAEVIMLTKKRMPVLQSRLVPVKAGDNFVLEVNAHFTKGNADRVLKQIGATIAGSLIADLPRSSLGGAGTESGKIAEKGLPMLGLGVALSPALLEKRKGKPIYKHLTYPKAKNGWGVPNAYLKYSLYNQEGVLTESDFMPIDKAAKDNWQKLYLTKEVTRDGYMTIEMGNSSPQPVWFDQMKLTKQGKVQRNPLIAPEKLNKGPAKGEVAIIPHDSTFQTNGYCEMICVVTPYGENCYLDCYDTPPHCNDDPNYCDCLTWYGDRAYCDCAVRGECGDDNDGNNDNDNNNNGDDDDGNNGPGNNDLQTDDAVTHPGKINLKTSNKTAIAQHFKSYSILHY